MAWVACLYFVEKTKTESVFKRYDYVLLIAVSLLTGVGAVVLRSASRTMTGGSRMMLIQTISIIIGAALAVLLSFIDYKIFKPLGPFLYAATTLLLIIVLKFGYGREETGSRSWLMIPGINTTMQPSEAAKISFIIMTAFFLERIREEQGKYNYLKLIAVAAAPIGLVLLQPDNGTALVFIVILATMLFVWGFKYRYILIALGAAAAAAPLVWLFALSTESKSRIMEFLTPGQDPSGASYQLNKAKMAIGSGRIFGQGLGNGIQSQTPVGGIPVKESDSIFAVVGEELGFIGTSLILLLILIILIRCLVIAKNSRDNFGSYIVAGITGMFAFHFFENIGMNLGILPMTGIPLPFVSQGGTAMMTNYISIGIVLSISLRRKKKQFSN